MTSSEKGASPGAAEGGATTWSVLVVEDDPLQARILREVLAELGAEVRVARDGQTAIEEARLRPPDVALVDLGLPDVSGYDVARALRAVPAPSARLLVAMSGGSGEEERRRAREAGFARFLAKPLCLEELERTVLARSER
jgi:CheY-like chemotaxis protein